MLILFNIYNTIDIYKNFCKIFIVKLTKKIYKFGSIIYVIWNERNDYIKKLKKKVNNKKCEQNYIIENYKNIKFNIFW